MAFVLHELMKEEGLSSSLQGISRCFAAFLKPRASGDKKPLIAL